MRNAVIFDGACGFCTWIVRNVERWNGAQRWTFVPFQRLSDADLASIGTNRASVAKSVHAIDERGRVSRGAFAVNAVLATLPATRPFVVIVRILFPLLLLEIAGYAFVARNRVWISKLLGTAKYALYDR